jgi:hypothetical protein
MFHLCDLQKIKKKLTKRSGKLSEKPESRKMSRHVTFQLNIFQKRKIKIVQSRVA